MNDAIGIGFFQFDNLIRNRVPFCLFSYSISLQEIYQGQEAAHVTRYLQVVQEPQAFDQAKAFLETLNYRKIDPVLVICQSGSESQKLANRLAQDGYLNCYFVEGGYLHLQESVQK